MHDSFGARFSSEINNVQLEGYYDDCHWYTYLNESKDLQISIEHPTPRQDNIIARTYQYSRVPQIPQAHMAMIETALTCGVLPVNVDKKTCLLAFYKSMLVDAEWCYQLESLNSGVSWPRHVFINPVGNLRGGQLAFCNKCSFTWHLTRWDDSEHDCLSCKVGNWT
ncbi:hypothetical protein AX15_002751, partial [Amanita polypyramis BW_CC]